MFRDAYRKANDAIHAPQSILDAVKAASEAERDADEPFELFPQKKKRVWPRVLAFSGAGIAVAALAVLVLLPKRLGRPEMQMTASAADTAEIVHSEEAYGAAKYAQEAAIVTEGAEEEPMLLSALDATPAEAEAARVDGGRDEDDDFYEYEAGAVEQTYADVFALLQPTERVASETNTVASEIDADGVTVTAAEDGVRIDGTLFVDPQRALLAAVRDEDTLWLLFADGDATQVEVYRRGNDGWEQSGAGSVSGVYDAHEVRDATLFGSDNQLEQHRVLLVTTRFAPDLSNAAANAPESFCPLLTDATGTSTMSADTIGLYGEGDTFWVYAAFESIDAVRVVYAFAELGLE